MGQTVSSTSLDSYDDFYRFTTPSDGTVQIYFNNPQYSSGMWDVYLRDMNGNTIDDYDFDADAVSHVGTKIGLPKGTYTIEVSPWGGSYGRTYTLRVAEPPQSKAMHRLYNQWTGEHFYTASATERDSLTSVGWTYEGVGWVAPTSGQAVYRLYNPYVEGGDHHYTMDVEEYDTLETLGWEQEGVGWRSGGAVKVYRQYNPYATIGTHNHTTSTHERDVLMAAGWKDEGIAWYEVSGK